MSHSDRVSFTLVTAIIAVIALSGWQAFTQSSIQPVNDLPNPYTTVENWAKMPEGRKWGATSAVEIAPDGRSIWVAERCGANTCVGSNLPSILKFDASGKLVRSFGEGMFIFPHGFYVDRQGNVWVTDGIPPGAAAQVPAGKGHIVVKFSHDGKVLLTLGRAGVNGDGPDTFNQPSDVVVAPNGDIFVADGHGGNSNARIVKFSGDGKFVKAWGKKGTAPGEFDTPHTLALDSKGRLFVGDRNNNRIQIFDQDGGFLAEWKQFSRPSGIFITRDDVIYVTDSESNARRNPGWKRGIRIGSARDGKVTSFIPDPEPNPDSGPGAGTSGAEGVAVDAQGNVYGAEVGPRALRKYVRK
ncbi:MAG TPA: peptidyl-alpha-hydroxyglycine alpha-amidating lyase family protein [Blastocatellia bacterium]|nr:peptidyl-alpha-hydroxyglycine alpha-amidating lyase family protein [Blastocatellia bacterium]